MSPTVRQIGPYSFRFYSSDGDEPRHIHVYARGHQAKFWLQPVQLAWNRGFRPSELNEIERHIRDHLAFLIAAWDDFFREAGDE